MAQPQKVAHEPTMDEILASIRRIIEDGEGTVSAQKAPMPEEIVEQVTGSAASQAAPAPLPEQTIVAKPVEPIQHEPANVNFRRRQAAALGQVLEEPVQEEVLAPVSEPAASPSSVNEQIDAALANVALDETIADVEVEGPENTEPESIATLRSIMAQHAALPDQSTSLAITDDALTSDETRTQVASAFDELSAAFSVDNSRSFDEVAEEVAERMLQPLLRDWLDNNLPNLVERLVREEIERIARGEQA